jgi:hypothetical protein
MHAVPLCAKVADLWQHAYEMGQLNMRHPLKTANHKHDKKPIFISKSCEIWDYEADS